MTISSLHCFQTKWSQCKQNQLKTSHAISCVGNYKVHRRHPKTIMYFLEEVNNERNKLDLDNQSNIRRIIHLAMSC